MASKSLSIGEVFLFTPQNRLVCNRAGAVYSWGKKEWKAKMEILGKLLGGIQRVKIMRLFLLNPEQGYEMDQIAERSRIQIGAARRVTNQLTAMSLVKKKSFIKEVADGRSGKVKKKRVQGWFLNNEFPYIIELKQLLIEGDFFKHADLVKRFRPAGRIQFLVVSGIFIQNSESRLDVLIVGDHLKRSVIQKAISVLESELGKELTYAVFEVADFEYRVSMYDKLLRDVFDFPHERLIAIKDFSTFVFPN
jgi:hypothetical protein